MRECKNCLFWQRSRKNEGVFICTRYNPPKVMHSCEACEEYVEDVRKLLTVLREAKSRIFAYSNDLIRLGNLPARAELKRELGDQIDSLAEQVIELNNTAIWLINKLDQSMPRTVIEMRYVNGLTWKEISHIVGYEIAQLHRYHRMALAQLQRLWDEMKEEQK